jgi:hypothetical protein
MYSGAGAPRSVDGSRRPVDPMARRRGNRRRESFGMAVVVGMDR